MGRMPISDSLWHRVGPILSPFAWLYGMGVYVRNLTYDRGLARSVSLSIPVISVGNLTVGGTGKTPVTLRIARMLQNPPYSLTPAVLSRGYRRSSSGYHLVSSGEKALCDWRLSGDEAQLYARKLAGAYVAVDGDRVHGGRTLIERFSPSVLLLDDAFQHRRLHRDLDIVLVDKSIHSGKNHLLPAGPLREPASSLQRAHLIILTRYEPGEDESDDCWKALVARVGETRLAACRIRPQAYVQLRDDERLSPETLKGKRVVAFSGIARPERFESMLAQLKLEVVLSIRFPDHHHYRAGDAEKLAIAFTDKKADYLITTEKDGVKLGGLFKALPILALEIEIEWLKGLNNLKNQLDRLFA